MAITAYDSINTEAGRRSGIESSPGSSVFQVEPENDHHKTSDYYTWGGASLTPKPAAPSTWRNASTSKGFYTMSQIRRHNHAGSAWLVAGDDIYDATSYLQKHPGGTMSILRKAGGVCDCTEDLQFHSRKGRKLWQQFHIGKVEPCRTTTDHDGDDSQRQWWMFWSA